VVSWHPIPEAPQGRGDGWFVVNVADGQALHTDRYGDGCLFEDRPDHMFPEFGINVRVLQPGQPNAMYHRENAQEAFLVLDGECVAIVEEQERPLRKGDFVHLPAGTAHVLIGAGDGPCAVLMVGTRKADASYLYAASQTAGRFGAALPEDTTDRSVPFKGVTPERKPLGRVPW
jgi:uncharacterized cupin superfamily protein